MPDEPVTTSVTTPIVTTPTPTPAPLPATTVTIPLDQLQTFTAMQSRLAQLEADQRQRDATTQAEMVAVLAKKGEVDNALALLRKQSDDAIAAERGQRAATEERAKRYALDGELARVLAAQPLTAHAAKHLTKLWRDEFKVEAQGDSFSVHTPTLQTVEAFVTAQLASPEYAGYVRANNPAGGTGGVTPATQAAPAVPATAPTEAPNMGLQILQHINDLRVAGGDGMTNMGQSFGLKRKQA
jgi:hypothetical protein